MRIWAIATVNLPGLSRGEAALVDPDKEGIRKRIASGVLRVCTTIESDRLSRITGHDGSDTP